MSARRSAAVSGAARAREWPRLLEAALRILVAVVVLWLVLHVPSGVPWPWDGGAFEAFDDVTWLAVLGFVALGAGLVWRGERAAVLVRRAPRWALDLALAAIAVLLVHRLSMTAFHGVAQVQDEIAYDRLARRFAVGHPAPVVDPLSEFFRIRFQVDDGRSYPLFQPGWPIFLAIGYLLHAPTFAPAFATAALVVAGSRLAERLYGRLTGLLAGVVLLSSGFVLWIGASYFAHALAAGLYALALERAIAASEPGLPRRLAVRRAIGGGLAAAWLVFTRLPTAAALTVPLIVVLVAARLDERRATQGAGTEPPPSPPSIRRSRLMPLVVAFTAAALLGPLAQAGWDLRTTGHALELPQDRYFALTEANARCHRLGFGDDIGCAREHPGEVPPEGFWPRRAVEVDRIRWETFRTDAFGSALPLALLALFVLRRGERGEGGEIGGGSEGARRLPRTAIVGAAVLAPIVIYTGFYYHAVQHGTRLWTECMGPIAVAMAAAIGAPFEAMTTPPRRWYGWVSRAASGLALAVLGVCACRELLLRTPERAAENGKNPQAPRVRQNLTDAHVPPHSLVFLNNCIEPDRSELVYGWAQVLDALPPEKGDWWLARDFGPEHDRQLLTEHPDWHPVRATCDGKPIGFPDATPSPRDVVTELEAKFPLEHRGAYPSVVGAETATNGMLLSIHVQSAGGTVAFPQHLFASGQWDVSLAFARRLDGGRFVVVVDGTVLDPPVEGGGPSGRRTWQTGAPIALEAGDHRVELRSIEGTGGYTNDVDRIELHARK